MAQGYHKVTKGFGAPSKQLSENTALVGMQYSELLHKCVGISRAEVILHKSAMPPHFCTPTDVVIDLLQVASLASATASSFTVRHQVMGQSGRSDKIFTSLRACAE